MDIDTTTSATAFTISDLLSLFAVESILLLVVLIVLPINAVHRAKSSSNLPLKGLSLPHGFVRSVQALTVVGSFVVFLVFVGTMPLIDERFTENLAALTGIAGTIIGFYFGSGGSGNSSEVMNTEKLVR